MIALTDNLSARQWRAVEALVEGRSYAEAAAAGAVSPRCLYKWRQQPAFREALERALVELHDRVHGRLEGLADLAVDRLRRVLEEGEDCHAVRAALGVLDRAGHGKPASPVAVTVAGTFEDRPERRLSDEELDAEIARLEREQAQARPVPN